MTASDVEMAKQGFLNVWAWASQFRRGAWLPSACRWCEGPTRRSGAGFVCLRCDAPEPRR